MRRGAFWLALIMVAAVVVFVADYSRPRTVAEACTHLSYTERAARVAESAGKFARTAETTGWERPKVAEKIDGGFRVLSIINAAFHAAKKTGDADSVIRELTPAPIDCVSTLDACAPATSTATLMGTGTEDVSIIQTAIALGKSRGIPEQGWVVILAAGMQESGIRNLDHGDRDSVGWLQQRPSQGWGTVQEIRNPAYAAGKFYDALVAVPGWETMPVTQAAQAVQKSGFPDAYARWEDNARRFVAQYGNASQTPQEPPQACGSVNLSVATWNGYKRNSDAAAIRGVTKLAAAGAGVIGLQEFMDEGRKRKLRAKLPGWTMVRDRYSIPIMVSPDFTVLASGVEVAMKRQRVEPGADGRTVGPREAVWATLQSRDGVTFSVINTHPVPSAGPGDAFDPRKPRRVRAYLEHVAYVTERMVPRLRRAGEVFATCDCNLTFDPFGMWAKAGMRSDASLGSLATKGRRQIDLVYSTATPAEHRVLAEYGSDHAAKLVSYLAAPAIADAPAGGRAYKLGPVKPQTQRFADMIGNRFKIDSIGGYRPRDRFPDHPSGLAVDLIVGADHAKGQAIADYVQANMDALGVDYLIWNQAIHNPPRPGWRAMSDRGDDSANHKNHVHVMMKG